MRFQVRHVTEYRYAVPASSSYDQAHLLPRSTPGQEVRSATLHIEPEPDDRRDRLDDHGNVVTYFALQRPHDSLTVTATSVIDREPLAVPASASHSWERAREEIDPEVVEFTLESPLVPALRELAEYARPSFEPGRPLLDAARELVGRIHRDVAFDPSATTVSTPLAEVLERRRGVCQDLAHLTIGCLRSCGLPTRYVSGYLETSPPPGQQRLVGADASHAWCAVRLADGSWLDLDPTNDTIAPERHLTVAWARDYSEVTPLKGVVMSPEAGMELEVSVDVERVASG